MKTTPFIKIILSFFLLLNLMEPSLAVADLKTNRLLKKITLPSGFKIQLYAENVPNARSMTLSVESEWYSICRHAEKGHCLCGSRQ
jgi:hypothetical protein